MRVALHFLKRCSFYSWFAVLFYYQQLRLKVGSLSWRRSSSTTNLRNQFYIYNKWLLLDHRGTRIELHKDQQRIIFYTIHTELPWKRLNVPDAIQLESRDTIFFSAGKGNISTDQPGNGNIPKVVFYDNGQIIYQFQMGSGRFERK